jgi:predicted nuclease with TOPRIM domain
MNEDPLAERVTTLEVKVGRLEEAFSFLKNDVSDIKKNMEKISDRVWLILAGVIVSILTQILLRLL